MTKKNNIPHESAVQHVTGEAVYVEDILVNEQLLSGHVAYSPHASARLRSFDLSAAQALEGVHAVLCYKDVPGANQMGPVAHDEPCLAEDTVEFVGQAMFLIAADSAEICRQAEKLITVEYETLTPVLDLEESIRKGNRLAPPRKIERGDVDGVLKTAPNVVEGVLKTGAQEHWYLETQSCLCLPGEGHEINVFSSTQHPSETQALIAEVLGIKKNEVVVDVRRMGGAFGGKETQANHTACWTALLCRATGRPVRIKLFRDDDQKITGKRHPFLIKYKAGFDNDGRILAMDVELNSDAGSSTDLSRAILERAMLHAENAYFIPHIRIVGQAWKTNLPSNTAFRGFGGPQGMAGIETVIDRIARELGLDSADVRFKNFYGITENNETPYGEPVENNRLPMLFGQLSESSEYARRKSEVDAFNERTGFFKRGIAMTPVKFGISFTTSFLNQAGALVNIYKDGSVLVNHGGTEMGQGLHTKIRQIAAAELGVSLEHVKVNATNTSKVPNTSATAASAGTDLNGMAVKDAIEKLKTRIAHGVSAVFNERFDEGVTEAKDIGFENDEIFDNKNNDRRIPFAEAMPLMNLRQVSLSATGFYKTPDIVFDREKGRGRPFHYFAFGMAVTEIELDILTGHHEILRTDILHDVGDSLNPAIDLGQVEGGYVQGVGWCTTEEVKRDAQGHLLNNSPDTYKIPSVQDIPKDFRTRLLQGVPNPNTIRRSKAVAEPPFMLGLSAWLAIKYAVSAVGDHVFEPEFSLPATNEVILLSLEKLKKKKQQPQPA